MSRTNSLLMSCRTPQQLSGWLDSLLSSDLDHAGIWNEVVNGTSKLLNYRKDVTEDGVVYEIEVPGVEPSDIAVKVEGRLLKVKTPRGHIHLPVSERGDVSRTEATLKYGILNVSIPFNTSDIVEVNVRID